MEALLHFAWQQRLWSDLKPVGVLEGCEVEVIDVGFCNQDAGPDFFEAKIRIDDIVWIGTVEIHQKASEWLKHEHHLDKAYSGVIIHIVELYDVPVLGYNARPLPTLVMTIPKELKARAKYFTTHAQYLPCSPLGGRLSDTDIYLQLDLLSKQRLEQKAEAISLLAKEFDWHEALYITILRYFGFNLNNDAMERLARSLPYKLLIRYTSNLLQFEALLLGQAQLITSLKPSDYKEALEREYQFLRTKHQLNPLPEGLFRLARTRPQSSPLRRLIQVASIIAKSNFNPSCVAQLYNMEGLKDFFNPRPISSYWQEIFSKQSQSLGLSIGTEMLYSLIINIALPLQMAMCRERNPYYTGERELKHLQQLPPEYNQITRRFERAGIQLRHAGDSQAVIQNYKSLCKTRKCLYCPWGRRLMLQSQ